MREKGYLHARSDAALALLRLGQCLHACQLADAGLADFRVFGALRARNHGARRDYRLGLTAKATWPSGSRQ